MTERNYEVIESGKAPIKAWIKGVPFEPEAKKQLLNIARLPFIYKWVAAMPDVHLGKGATIGSVIPTDGAIIPAAVGVDLGCGMMAVRTQFTAADLAGKNLDVLHEQISRSVPLSAGHDNKKVRDTAAPRVEELRSLAGAEQADAVAR